MKQASIDFQELPDDPVQKAEQDVIWWLVNRIRTRAEAMEAFRVASACVAVISDSGTGSSRSVKLRSALGAVSDALATWDETGPTDADKLQLWDALDALLARRARETIRADLAAWFQYGRLLFSALRNAYAIQKHGNEAAVRLGRGVSR